MDRLRACGILKGDVCDVCELVWIEVEIEMHRDCVCVLYAGKVTTSLSYKTVTTIAICLYKAMCIAHDDRNIEH